MFNTRFSIIHNNLKALNIFLKVIEDMRGPIVFTWLTKAPNQKSYTFTTSRTSALFPGLKSTPTFFLIYIILGNKILQLIHFCLNYLYEHTRYSRQNKLILLCGSSARWLSWLKRLTSNEEIPSSNLGRAFLSRKYSHSPLPTQFRFKEDIIGLFKFEVVHQFASS